MNLKQIEQYRKAADDGSLPDKENPIFLFQTTSTSLLVKIVNGEISPTHLARYELRGRGLDDVGENIGFRINGEDMLKPLRKEKLKPGVCRKPGIRRGRSL